MTGAGALTPQEIDIVDALSHKGVPRETATLAVVMWARRHIRPEAELLELISNYPSLDHIDLRRRALVDARARAWVIDVPSRFGGSAIIQASPDLVGSLGALIPDRWHQLQQIRRDQTSVRILGHMGEHEVFDSFSTRLGEARSDIALPAIMTTHQLSAVEVLKARAQAGVKVRLLLATADLAGDIRGANMIVTAKNRLKGWKRNAKGQRNFEVRVTRHRDDLRDASSMLIDGRLLRYDIYDDEVERSTDGVMIEVGRSGPTNLSRMFRDRFEDAWLRARPLGFWRSLGWAIRRWWYLGLVVVGTLVFARFRVEHPNATALFLGGVVGYLVNKVDPFLKGVKKWWDRQRA